MQPRGKKKVGTHVRTNFLIFHVCNDETVMSYTDEDALILVGRGLHYAWIQSPSTIFKTNTEALIIFSPKWSSSKDS